MSEGRTPQRVVNRWHYWGRFHWYWHGKPYVFSRPIWTPRRGPHMHHVAYVGPLMLSVWPKRKALENDGSDG